MPEYLHPSTNSRIEDNSAVALTADGTTILFAAFMSEKGIDNKLTRFTTPSDFEVNNGKPNLPKYGQAGYNVSRWLEAGGEVYGIRVLPTDARYATALLSIEAKTGASPAVNSIVPHITSVSGTSVGALETILAADPVSAADTVTYPLGIFYPRGRGAAYNGIGFRFQLMDGMDGTYAFRTYTFEITQKSETNEDVIVDGPFMVSFDVASKNRASLESMYYADVINKYSKILKVLETSRWLDEIAKFINPAADPKGLDFLFGKERADVAEVDFEHDLIKFATPASTGLAANQVTNVTAALYSSINYLANGFDGTWEAANSADSLLARAYKGLIDEAVLSKTEYPFDVILDANYPLSVKNAIAETVQDGVRDDIIAILDTGFQASPEQAIQFRTTSLGISSRNVAIFTQDFTVDDTFNGTVIKVTPTYFLANKIPANDNAYGLHWTFVGPRRGVLTGFNDCSWYPNPAWKESLYKKQLNYVEKDPKRINFATQTTSQTFNSALSDLNNVRTINRIRREVDEMLSEYRDEFNDATTYESMSYNVNNYLVKWRNNRACSSISASIYASDYDRQQKIVRCRIEMRFTGIIERVFTVLSVNR